jgi:hypothetical protein
MSKDKTTKITITDDRFGANAGVGVNGRRFIIPTGGEVEVDEGVLDVLRNSGVAFSISDQADGPDNAVSVSRTDPPLSGGPKVVDGAGKEERDIPSFRAGTIDDDVELGEGSSVAGSVSAAGSNPSATDFSHDTGGASAPTPGSRDTIATSAQPTTDAKPAAKRSTAKRTAKK